MKRQTKTFFRSFYLTLVILLCISIGWIGITTAWENIVQVAFGRYDKAVEITDDTIRILDFTIK
ncbi:MAG: hypothetical protein IKT42_07465 [Clostridia bacterium]|nr:hypothetical protein [Clostridia bacterium]